MRTIRIGAGAGYSGDRIEPAVELAEKGNIDYLIFECLAERTIAIAQQAKMKDPAMGYDPLLEERMQRVLPVCHRNGIKILTNMGAANPLAAAVLVKRIADELGLNGVRVAVVQGDDVLDILRAGNYTLDSGDHVGQLGEKALSANAYLGASPLVEALAQGADVIICGRVADPALVLAPLIHAFGWAMDDWERLGRGTLAGHLLECAGQITGGYFADPGFKDVPRLARLGFPIGEIDEDGNVIITKVEGSGGVVNPAICKEQMLYEIHDPSAYLTPDVIADLTGVRMEDLGNDRVRITGATGKARPENLKVSVGYIDSYVGEGQISYAGSGALQRGRLALSIVKQRFEITGVKASELRFDIIGVNAIHGDHLGMHSDPYEVRIRVTGRTDSLKEAIKIGNEVETLYTCGPAGGGGATKSAREIIAVQSAYIPRTLVQPRVQLLQEA